MSQHSQTNEATRSEEIGSSQSKSKSGRISKKDWAEIERLEALHRAACNSSLDDVAYVSLEARDNMALTCGPVSSKTMHMTPRQAGIYLASVMDLLTARDRHPRTVTWYAAQGVRA